MSKKANPAWIGAFVIGVGVLATAGLILFGSGRLFSNKSEFVCYFDGSVKGLNVGSPVRFRGVKVGQVKEVRIILELETLSTRLPVIIEIDPERLVGARAEESWFKLETLAQRRTRMSDLAQHGLRAVLGLDSFVTGQLSVEVDFYPGTPVKYRAREDDTRGGLEDMIEIPTKPSELEMLTRTLQDVPIKEVVDKLMSSLNAVEKFVNSPELLEMAQTGAKAASEARELLASARKTIETLGGSIDSTLVEARTVIREVQGRIGPLNEAMTTMVDSLRESMKKVDTLVESLSSVAGPRSEIQRELVQTLREASEAARAVRVLAETLERNPEALLMGKPETGGD